MDVRKREPLKTLELMVGAIFALMSVFVGATLVGVIAGQASIPGLNAEVCVTSVVGEDIAFRDGHREMEPTRR